MTRRDWLCMVGAVGAAGLLGSVACSRRSGATLLGRVPFSDPERWPAARYPAGQRFGEGLDGHVYTDLEDLEPDQLDIAPDQFYVRTCASTLLPPADSWKIRITGLVASGRTLPIDELNARTQPMGTHLLECSGNNRAFGFRLLSSGRWSGVPMASLLDELKPLPQATHVLINGFDTYPHPSVSDSPRSIPGASWVFTPQQLRAGAFLATRLDDAPLPRDHGQPVRLIVPRWYGCANIKWVDEIRFVADTEPSTSQMREFASRTHQDGVPELARDFRPAAIDLAAMPVRIEKWRGADGKLFYRVVGIMWGGEQPTDQLAISFDDGQSWESLDDCPKPASSDSWSMWSHLFRPRQSGTYPMQLRCLDPSVRTRRLSQGYYVRHVRIDEAAG
jgi:DMSO/TMAO reductase YedYZ molybdopterin-dependent catalytic subunit